MGSVKTSGAQGIRTASMGSWAAWVLDSLPYSQSRREGVFSETPIYKPAYLYGAGPYKGALASITRRSS
jgi:hypothetical protein